MASFILYERIPDKIIESGRKELIAKTEEFFKNNPRRRVANVGVWYGDVAKIRRNHVKEDVDAAIQVAKGNQCN